MRRKMNMLLIGMMMFLVIGLSVNAFTKEKETDEFKPFYKYYTQYYVDHGDTLYGIAEKFMEEYPLTKEVWSQREYADVIANTNNLSSTKIIAGNHLVIPYISEELK